MSWPRSSRSRTVTCLGHGAVPGPGAGTFVPGLPLVKFGAHSLVMGGWGFHSLGSSRASQLGSGCLGKALGCSGRGGARGCQACWQCGSPTPGTGRRQGLACGVRQCSSTLCLLLAAPSWPPAALGLSCRHAGPALAADSQPGCCQEWLSLPHPQPQVLFPMCVHMMI